MLVLSNTKMLWSLRLHQRKESGNIIMTVKTCEDCTHEMVQGRERDVYVSFL